MDIKGSLGASIEVYKMILFFSGIILWILILIIHIIPFWVVSVCLIAGMVAGYSFVWYIAAKPWEAQKGDKNARNGT